jgi:hypothetical protein
MSFFNAFPSGASSLASGSLYGIACSADGSKLIVGDNTGTVYRYNGSSWSGQSYSPGSLMFGCAMSQDGNRQYFGDSAGHLWASSDGGATFVQVANLGTGARVLVACDGPGGRVCVASGSQVFRADFSTWALGDPSPMFSPVLAVGGASFLGIAAAQGTSGMSAKFVAFNRGGSLYTSNNGGMTWDPIPGQPGGIEWYAVAYSTDGSKIFAGDYGGTSGLYQVVNGAFTLLYTDPNYSGFTGLSTNAAGSIVIGNHAAGAITYSSNLASFTVQSIPGGQTTWSSAYASIDDQFYSIVSGVGVYAWDLTPDIPPSKPSIPTADSVGDGSVTLSWSAPSANGSAISGYTFSITNTMTNEVSTSSALAGATTKTFTGLVNETLYSFTFRAESNNGASPYSDPVTATPSAAPPPPPPAPMPPSNVVATASLYNGVRVTWTASSTPGISGYTITVTSESEATKTYSAGGSATSYTITDLTVGVVYSVSMTASTSLSISSPAAASSTVTLLSSAGVTTSIETSGSSFVTSYIGDAPAATNTERTTLATDMRRSILAATASAPENKAALVAAYIDGMRSKLSGADSFTASSDQFNDFLQSFASPPVGLTPKPVEVFVPNYVGTSATVDVASVSTSSYLHVEVPPGYSFTLTNGANSITLTYDGTSYTSGGVTYGVNAQIILGSKIYTILGIGSVLFNNGNYNNIPCITRGTPILGPGGAYRAVEDLQPGDLVVTGDGRRVPVLQTKVITVVGTNEKTAPYVIEKGALRAGVPAARLELSGEHALQVAEGVWEFPCLAAKDYRGVKQAPLGGSVTYYHLTLPVYETDSLVTTGGQVLESFNDGSRVTQSYSWDARARGYVRSLRPARGAPRNAVKA